MSSLPLNQGISQNQYYSAADIVAGDSSGHTDTDSLTDPNTNPAYTKINTKRGKPAKGKN